jgi:sodium transport system permease protein
MSFTVDLMSGIYLFITLLPLAVIFSALLMALSLYAKSFREAQTYISPLMVLAIIPAMASMMPDTESNPLISLIPVVNVSLLLRNTLMGTIEILPFVLTMASNLVIAAIALYVVFLMFRRESVLFRI